MIFLLFNTNYTSTLYMIIELTIIEFFICTIISVDIFIDN